MTLAVTDDLLLSVVTPEPADVGDAVKVHFPASETLAFPDASMGSLAASVTAT